VSDQVAAATVVARAATEGAVRFFGPSLTTHRSVMVTKRVCK
jgi:hypothetical protein